MFSSTRSLKKCEPSETSGMTSPIRTISHRADTRWISAKETGTPCRSWVTSAA
jgi:hypothetical protein